MTTPKNCTKGRFPGRAIAVLGAASAAAAAVESGPPPPRPGSRHARH